MLKEEFDCSTVTYTEMRSLPTVALRPLLLNVYGAVKRGVLNLLCVWLLLKEGFDCSTVTYIEVRSLPAVSSVLPSPSVLWPAAFAAPLPPVFSTPPHWLWPGSQTAISDS